MTALDEGRAKAQLAQKARVGVEHVSRMIIWGNHSATQYPDFYHALIRGIPAPEIISDTSWAQGDFIETVQKRGAAIIKSRGASSAASAAHSVVESLRNLTNDTDGSDTDGDGKELYSMALNSSGEYGIDPGLVFSFPCRTENGKVKVVTGLDHDEFAQQKIQRTLQELRSERDTVKQLGFISDSSRK